MLGSGQAGSGIMGPEEVEGGTSSIGSSGSSAMSAKLWRECLGGSRKTKVSSARKGDRGTRPKGWWGAESRDVVLVNGGWGEGAVGYCGGVARVLAVETGSISHASKLKTSKV